jgi:alpha-mannosidase
MRGRKPIPTALHLLRGTFRPDRHGDRATAEAAFMPSRQPAPPSPWDKLKLPGMTRRDDDEPPPDPS